MGSKYNHITLNMKAVFQDQSAKKFHFPCKVQQRQYFICEVPWSETGELCNKKNHFFFVACIKRQNQVLWLRPPGRLEGAIFSN